MACWGFLFLRWGELRITSAKSLSLSLALTFCYRAAIWLEPKWILAEWRTSVVNDGCESLHTLWSEMPFRILFYTPHKSHVSVLNRSELRLAVGGRFTCQFHLVTDSTVHIWRSVVTLYIIHWLLLEVYTMIDGSFMEFYICSNSYEFLLSVASGLRFLN